MTMLVILAIMVLPWMWRTLGPVESIIGVLMVGCRRASCSPS
jgi:hypothetical protein